MPIGKEAALLPHDVSYNVCGLFQFSKLMYKLIDFVERKFDYKLPIKYLYGSPSVRWNGGRLILKSKDYTLSDSERELNTALENGIIPLITFSNTLLTLDDLKNSYCNNMLKIINDCHGEIIVSSELLREHILLKYPDIPVHSSVIPTAFCRSRGLKYYSELNSKYSHYVVHPDDNFNLKLLDDLPKDKAEIIVNERCMYQCPIRNNHYESISREQISLSEHAFVNSNFLSACSFIPEYKQYSEKERNISLTIDEMKNIANMGYKIFKVQGRTDNMYVYFFDLLRYTLDNKMAFPTAFSIFSNYIDEFIRGN